MAQAALLVNEGFFELDAAAQIFDGRAILPIRPVLEVVGHYVGCDVATNTVVVRTNTGNIHLRLSPTHTPLAVKNFVTLAQNGSYDGTIFHRVINDFMIQGVDPTGAGIGAKAYGTCCLVTR